MKKRIIRQVFAMLLALTLSIGMGVTAFAAESDATMQSSSEVRSAEVTEPALSTSEDNSNVEPRSIYGYAAKYTNPMSGSFTVNAPGSGNSRGTFQITTHDFPGSPIINAVLYRPDGSYACQIYIDGNGTKKAYFSNAIAGNYRIVYTVEGVNPGWISAWVSS